MGLVYLPIWMVWFLWSMYRYMYNPPMDAHGKTSQLPFVFWIPRGIVFRRRNVLTHTIHGCLVYLTIHEKPIKKFNHFHGSVNIPFGNHGSVMGNITSICLGNLRFHPFFSSQFWMFQLGGLLGGLKRSVGYNVHRKLMTYQHCFQPQLQRKFHHFQVALRVGWS